ncbi:MAG: DUF89 family protein [Anaerolineae bacterium]|nr:DUF89 family protein [Anaerolineae bacterium]
MKTQLECLPCFMKQAVLTAQRITGDPQRVLETVQLAAAHFGDISLDESPAEAASRLAWIAAQHLGVDDPYAEQKALYNDLALQAYDVLKAYVQAAPDPLAAAVRVAAVGNMMDLAIFDRVDMNVAVEHARSTTWAIDHTDRLKHDIAAADTILVLADNAGEIVFDRVLVEMLPPGRVTYAVKGGPMSCDVTRDDARAVGMDAVAHIIDTGTATMGAPLNLCSDAFLQAFDRADVIIAKGMANIETLSEVDANIYFILKVKCEPMAAYLSVPVDSILMLSQQERLHGSS